MLYHAPHITWSIYTKIGIFIELRNIVRQVRFSCWLITVCHGISHFSSGYSSKFPKDFSTVSRSHFKKYILSQKPRCLLQTLVPKNMMIKPVCGNQLLEVGEVCDCGSPEVWKYPRFKTFTKELLLHKNYTVFFFFFFLQNVLLEILFKDKLGILVKSRLVLVFSTAFSNLLKSTSKPGYTYDMILWSSV